MASSHLKRIVAPKTWPIIRKTTKFITRPKPKGHPLELTLPAVVVMRDVLKIVDNRSQARIVLRTQDVTVNGHRIYDVDSAVGFMDLLSINGSSHRISINKNNQLVVLPVKSGEEFSVERITGKTHLKGGKIQINCASGHNFLVAKDEYKVGDSIAVQKGKVLHHYPLAKGACVLMTGGVHIGTVGTVENIEGQILTITEKNGQFTTTRRTAYVVGTGKPAITLE